MLLWAPLRRAAVWICFVLMWARFLTYGWNRFGALMLSLFLVRLGKHSTNNHIASLFKNGAKICDLSCVLHPSLPRGCRVPKTRLDSRIKKFNPMFIYG